MPIVNDNSCGWINDLPVRTSIKSISKNENCFILSRDIIKDLSKNNKYLTKPMVMELIDIILCDNNQKSDGNPKGAIVSTIYKLEKSISLNQKLEL